MALCCRLWTSSAGAARARIFPWLERVPDLPVNAPAFFSSRHESQRRCVMQTYYEGEQVSMFDQDGFYGRTSRVRSRAERRRAKTSGSFWRRYSESVSIPYQFLDLTPGHGDLLGEPYWEIRSPLRGEHSTLNTGESPQRRRRIFLIADLGGLRAEEILFDANGLSWNPPPRPTAWKRIALSLEARLGTPERLTTTDTESAGDTSR